MGSHECQSSNCGIRPRSNRITGGVEAIALNTIPRAKDAIAMVKTIVALCAPRQETRSSRKRITAIPAHRWFMFHVSNLVSVVDNFHHRHKTRMPRGVKKLVSAAAKKATKGRKKTSVKVVDQRQFKTGPIRNAIGYSGSAKFSITGIEPTHGVSGFQSTGVAPGSFNYQVRASSSAFMRPNVDPSSSGLGIQAHTPGAPRRRDQDPAFTGESDSTVVQRIDFDDEELSTQYRMGGGAMSLTYHEEAQQQVHRGTSPHMASEGMARDDPGLTRAISTIEEGLELTGRIQPSEVWHAEHTPSPTSRQNMEENGTFNVFEEDVMHPTSGNDHLNLAHALTPAFMNDSNTASGTHFNYGNAPLPRTSGTISFSLTRQKPVTLADLGAPPQPDIQPGMGPGRLGSTSVSLYV